MVNFVRPSTVQGNATHYHFQEMQMKEDFETTASIGHRINALAQAEDAVAEAEGMPDAVAARMDALIDRLTSD